MQMIKSAPGVNPVAKPDETWTRFVSVKDYCFIKRTVMIAFFISGIIYFILTIAGFSKISVFDFYVPKILMLLYILLSALAVLILHEFLHILIYPKAFRSNKAVFVLGYKPLTVCTFFNGALTKKRQLIELLSPLVALTVIFSLISAVSQSPVISYLLNLAILINFIVSSYDAASALYIALFHQKNTLFYAEQYFKTAE